jgi:cysteine desulfurase
MLPYLSDRIGNPLSKHILGEKPREAVEQARAEVAQLIHANPEEIIFTTCGSESNNLAVKGIAEAYSKKGKHIIASPIEHHSVLHPLKRLERQGYEVSWLKADKVGTVDPGEIASLTREDTVLITVTSASNEIGTLEPVGKIGKIARGKDILFHTDAIACAGSIPIDVQDLPVDLLSIAGNPFYGPPGSGALYVRKGLRIAPIIEGGIQEGGVRAGTHNVAGIVGMGTAAKLAHDKLAERQDHLVTLRDKLINGVQARISDCFLTGHPIERLPGHASFCVQFIEGESILMHLSFLGIAATSGSTCSSEALKVSHVLEAIGIDPVWAQGSVMFTLGIEDTDQEVEFLLKELPPIVDRLRKMSPLAGKSISE